MQWQAASLFATPVFKLAFENAPLAKKFFDENLKDTSEKDIKDQQGVLSHYHSRHNIFSIYPELKWLEKQIEKAGNLVYQDLMNFKKSGPMRITNAWFNLCEVGGSQPAHNHVNCLLCGTLYLHTDANTKIYFHHPQKTDSHHAELFDSPDTTPNEHGLSFHQQESQIDVNAGDCLFWPSRLMHGYSQNKTPGRLSLSFNMMPEKLNVDYQINTALPS